MLDSQAVFSWIPDVLAVYMSDEAVVESVVQRPDGVPQEVTTAGDLPHKRDAEGSNPSRKRSRIDTGDEERKRGKRLFGGLLGTLGGIKKEASSVKAQERATRQAELEQRKQERLKQAADDLATKQAENAAAEARSREEEEKALQGRVLEAKHEQKILLANHLVTVTNLPLYYLPWRMTADQEERINEQLRRAKQEQSEALKLLSPIADSTHEPTQTMNRDTDMQDSGIVDVSSTENTTTQMKQTKLDELQSIQSSKDCDARDGQPAENSRPRSVETGPERQEASVIAVADSQKQSSNENTMDGMDATIGLGLTGKALALSNHVDRSKLTQDSSDASEAVQTVRGETDYPNHAKVNSLEQVPL